MRGIRRNVAIGAMVGVLGILLISGLTAATGGSYTQSYTRATNSTLPANVDLVAASSSYSSGPNLTVSFSVAGTVVTNDYNFSYTFWFDGDWTENATAALSVGYAPSLGSNTTTTARLYLYSNGAAAGEEWIPFQVNGGTVSASVATSAVGPADSFAVNVVASDYIRGGPSTTNWLGTGFSEGSGSGGNPAPGTSTTSVPIGEIIWPIVIAIVVVVVIIVMVRRRRPPATSANAPAPPQQPTDAQSAGLPPPPPR